MIQAIIFDLFGTLTSKIGDPEAKIIKKFKLRKTNIDKYVCGTKFRNWDQYLDALVSGIGLKDTQRTRDILIEIFLEDIGEKRIDLHMIDFAKNLKSKGFRIGLLSNCPNPIFHLPKKYDVFDSSIYSDDVGLLKPSPKIYRLLLKKLKVKPDEALMIGDSIKTDVDGARAVGMQAIHYRNLNQLKKELKPILEAP